MVEIEDVEGQADVEDLGERTKTFTDQETEAVKRASRDLHVINAEKGIVKKRKEVAKLVRTTALKFMILQVL